MAFSGRKQDQGQWSVDEDERSLFFCVAQYYGSKPKVIYTGYSLDVNALCSSSADLDLKLKSAFTLSTKDQIGACPGLGVGLGYLILAGGFRANYSREKLVGEPCRNIWLMRRSNNFQPEVARFLAGKVRPLIWEFEGNLYALARNPPPPMCTGSLGDWSSCFEMYNSATGQWVSLPDPPSYSFQIPGRPGGGASDEDIKRFDFITCFSHAVIGSKVFITNPEHPDYAYTCNLSSDSYPIEWKISSVGFEGVTLGVKTAQGFVVFSYDITRSFDDVPDDSLVIGVQLLPDGCDEPEPCEPLILLPDFIYSAGDAQLVDLGDQKVCFLYSVEDGMKLTVNAIAFGFQLEEGNRLNHKLYPLRSWEFQNRDKACGWGVTQLVGAVLG